MKAALPEGWSCCRLDEIFSVQSGGTPSRKVSEYFAGGTIPWVKTGDFANADIKAVEERITEQAIRNSNAKVFPTGTILIAMYGEGKTRGQIARLTFPAATNQACAALVNDKLDSEMNQYVFNFLLGQYHDLRLESVGGNQPNLNLGTIKGWNINIAPPAEQNRIVAKVETLLARAKSSRERLGRIPAILKRFRQAVVAAACNGRLTNDLRGAKAAVRPEVSLGEITADIRTGPFGTALHKADYITGGVPVINPMNLVAGKIIASPNVTIDESTFIRLREYALREGDLIIARRGEMGRCALVGPTEAGWLCGTGCAILRLKPEARPAFVELVISSPITRAFLGEASVGTTMDNLNQKALRSMPIFLPELAEQDEIVQRVRSLYRFADQLEARLKKAQLILDKVPQSILAKAFRGDLVITEAELARREKRSYESAEHLLVRISNGHGRLANAVAQHEAPANGTRGRALDALGSRRR